MVKIIIVVIAKNTFIILYFSMGRIGGVKRMMSEENSLIMKKKNQS